MRLLGLTLCSGFLVAIFFSHSVFVFFFPCLRLITVEYMSSAFSKYNTMFFIWHDDDMMMTKMEEISWVLTVCPPQFSALDMHHCPMFSFHLKCTCTILFLTFSLKKWPLLSFPLWANLSVTCSMLSLLLCIQEIKDLVINHKTPQNKATCN